MFREEGITSISNAAQAADSKQKNRRAVAAVAPASSIRRGHQSPNLLPRRAEWNVLQLVNAWQFDARRDAGLTPALLLRVFKECSKRLACRGDRHALPSFEPFDVR